MVLTAIAGYISQMALPSPSHTLTRRSRWLRGPGVLYVLAAALGVTAFALAIRAYTLSRRVDDQLRRASLVQAELIAREYSELTRAETDSAVLRALGFVVRDRAGLARLSPRTVGTALAAASGCRCGPILPGTGATFVWRSDTPATLQASGPDPGAVDAIRRQLERLARGARDDRVLPGVMKTDADGRELVAPFAMRRHGDMTVVAAYLSTPGALADSIFRPASVRVAANRYGDVAAEVLAWRVIQPGGDTLLRIGTFNEREPFLSSPFLRSRFQVSAVSGSPGVESPDDTARPEIVSPGGRPDPRTTPYLVDVQVHPAILGSVLYGTPATPLLPIILLMLLAVVLTAATAGLARRFVRHMHEREAFATAVAHDLRTPLTQILLYGESLQLDRPAVQAREEAARVIVRETRRLIHIVENALEFVRGGRAKPSLRLQTLDFAALVAETLRGLDPVVARVDARVCRTGLDDIEVVADHDAVVQILTNLIDNALRFGPPGQVISAGIGIDGAFAVLTVDDQGPGIAASRRGQVFRPFVAGGDSAGAGIGLAVSRQLAELMDGSLAVEDAPHGGARLVLRLPLGRGMAAQQRSEGAPTTV